ncbi:MAG: HAD-IIIA family hydrolase [Acidobacteria bacterium]|nr:MAG: HAD-IIIA family hydrolase [Acidobacteriota bacterium]
MPAAPIVPEDLRTKLLRIRGVALDVDGVLTDGSLTFDEDGREWKSFDVKDGLGLVLLRDLGYKIGIISSRKSKVVSARCRELKIPEECVLQGELDKASALDRLLARWELNPSEVVAVGDDLPDLAMMRRAGVGACPSDAVAIVRDAAALHLTKPGGCGAVRELCDLLLEIRRGARADKPVAVPPAPPEPQNGDVIPFPTR